MIFHMSHGQVHLIAFSDTTFQRKKKIWTDNQSCAGAFFFFFFDLLLAFMQWLLFGTCAATNQILYCVRTKHYHSTVVSLCYIVTSIRFSLFVRILDFIPVSHYCRCSFHWKATGILVKLVKLYFSFTQPYFRQQNYSLRDSYFHLQ